jgi:VanZ family protein
MSAHRAAARSQLPHYLALLYGLAIVYASLQPFAQWMAPTPGTPFFLAAPWSPRWTRFDLIVNVLAYAPLGFFVALMGHGQPAWARLAGAVAAGAALSFALETAQMFLPSRDASIGDLLANVAGTAGGGLIGVAFAGSKRAARLAVDFRQHWFLPGKVGDLGLALLVIWLAVQVNPGIPLFATTFEPDIQLDPALATLPPAPADDVAAILVVAATSAFHLLGVGLFLALLLRQRRYVGGAVLTLIGAAVLVKGAAAALLLKPAAWGHWLSPGVPDGVAAGALLLLVAIWLPRPVQVALAAVALLSSVLAPLLTPDILFARAPLSGFNWSYGQLLNFNGLTHAVLLMWPVAASAFLFALAGRPGWGEPA